MSNAVYDVEGNAPNVAYGYGKAVWSGSSPGQNGGINSPGVSAPTGGGGGGCSMGMQNPLNALLWLLLPVYVLARKYRRA